MRSHPIAPLCSFTLIASGFLFPLLSTAAHAQSSADMFIGSRGFGSIYSPFSANPLPHDLLSGQDLLDFSLRGSGPSLQCSSGHLSLLAMPGTELLARAGAWDQFGIYRVDLLTGNRTLVPNTNGPLWASTSDMILVDPDTVLVVADDFVGGLSGSHVDDAKILRLQVSTGAVSVVSGSTVGDGIVMHRPRGIAQFNPNSILVVEVGQISASSLPGALLYRIDLATGNRTLLSSLNPQPTVRRVVSAGIIGPPSLITHVGNGPTFDEGLRGLACLDGRIFVAGSVWNVSDSTFQGGIIEVNPITGDRVLFAGSARLNGTIVTSPVGAGSDSPIPNSPTALQPRTARTLAFCSTFGPDKVWSIDIHHKKLSTLANLQDRISPGISQPLFTGLAIRRADCLNPQLAIAQQPVSGRACRSLPLPLNALAVSGGSGPANAPIEYQWEFSCSSSGPWMLVEDAQQAVSCATFMASGATQPSLLVSNLTPQNTTVYFRCLATTPCLSAYTDVVQAVAGCNTDIDCSGSLDFADLFGFLNLWFSAQPAADFNQDQAIEFSDLFEFLNAWFNGCP